MSMQEWLDQLNPEQREAVMINEGSLLVFAGAGSGKTRVITTKIAYAIEELGVDPYHILAVTFTNKACKEMQDRVMSMIGEESQRVMIKTFHSFGVWLLRRYGDSVGLDHNFKIYDEDESAALLCQTFPEKGKEILKAYYKRISLYKDSMETSKPDIIKYPDFQMIYNGYSAALNRSGNVDFADMIIKSIQLLNSNPDIRADIQERFRIILVDEYQDSNEAQFELLKQIIGPKTFICVVGDDDQSIYRFRGAQVKNILNFSNEFNNTKRIVLRTNYRCSENILNAAIDVIEKNKNREKKQLVASRLGGQIPKKYLVDDSFAEANEVAKILKRARLTDPNAYSNSAILYRTNAQSLVFENQFGKEGIPYRLIGSIRFYDREEVRDCIQMLSLLANPKDSVAFQRMINKPPRKVGDASLNHILSILGDNEINGDVILASEKAIEQKMIRGAAVDGVNSFLSAYKRSVSFLGKKKNGDFLSLVVDEFGIRNYYMMRDSSELKGTNERINNIGQLISILSEPEYCDGQQGLNNFFEIASLDASSLGEEGQSNSGVVLITMHNTKGLEFDRVFMVGMENEIFPRITSDELDDLEEERRICYVAMTRAKNELYLFSAATRLRWGQNQQETPSIFLNQIDSSHIEEIDLRLKSRFGGQFRFDNREQNSYRSGYGNGFGNSYTSYGYSPRQSTPKPTTPKPDASKYNVRNMAQKPILVKRHDASKSAPVPGTVKYEVGDRIRSEFYGEGTITNKRTFGGREVLDVKFDSGRTGTFASDKVAFEKI